MSPHERRGRNGEAGGEARVLNITLEAALQIAGVGTDYNLVEVLRDGFPSYVIRVQTAAFPGRPSVIIKACPGASTEPEVLRHLRSAGLSVPAVLDVRQGDGFRVIVLEDVGRDALYKHPCTLYYLRAAEEIAQIHRRFETWAPDMSHERVTPIATGATEMSTGAGPATIPAGADVIELLTRYDAATWSSAARAGARVTLQRFEDGTYQGWNQSEVKTLSDTLRRLEEETLAVLEELGEESTFPHTLVHGDYHDGNVLICPCEDAEARRFVVVDWDSARWDSGFFDLVSLCDVADRMGTIQLDHAQVLGSYLRERCGGADWPSPHAVDVEWHRCCLLRAWGELKWFSETGEDFGDRVSREVDIIRSQVRWFREQARFP